MQTLKIRKSNLAAQLEFKTIFRVIIVYLLTIVIIFSYIPFDIQYATIDREGHFILSPAIIEYAWLNPPQEIDGKMIAGVNWQRINYEMVFVTIIAVIFCITKRNKVC
jgi:hypothetical protein